MGIIRKVLYTSPSLSVLVSEGVPPLKIILQRTENGQDFYVFTVQPGNTVYAISKKFSVEPVDIIEANPDAKNGLSIGQEILIPIDKIDKRAARKTEVKLDGEYVMHTVQRKETLFSISRDYGVDINALMDVNPGKTDHLSTGMVLKIPIEKSTLAAQNYF